jgi:predicted DNA-binding transcriptional regulator
MDYDALQRCGLTKSEIDVYIALLRTGPTTITPLKNAIHVHPSKLYEHISSLEKKGLVAFTNTKKGKQFTASSPDSLLTLLNKKSQEIEQTKVSVEKTVHDLKTIIPEKKDEMPTMVYEGFDGFRQVYTDIILNKLKKGDTFYVMGAKVLANIKMENFFVQLHNKRAEKGIRFKILYNFDARYYAKKRAEIPLTEARYLPKKIPIPLYCVIAKDCVTLHYMTEKTSLSFLIKNKEIADGHLQYFNLMWRLGRSP